MPPQLMSFDPGQWYMLAHVVMAMGLGAVLGIEREWAKKPAGLRTHMLVAAAAALIVSMGDVLVESVEREVTGGVNLHTDPLRLVEAVIAGISFLGAGTIIRNSESGGVEGITTAASLLLTAAIGVCTAMGQVIAAVGTTLIVLVVLRVMGRLAEQTSARG